jgi:type II secretory pathway pseudopilin PulG
VIRFKSIISRIVILHVVAVVITSIFMSLALSWLLNYSTSNIHNKAMQEQAVSVGEHLSAQADGSLNLNLPPDLQGLYSQAYGRYSYAVCWRKSNTGRSLPRANCVMRSSKAPGRIYDPARYRLRS